jgi:hypothetical protein
VNADAFPATPAVDGSASFYADLEPFDDLADIASGDRFRPLPQDWTLILTDVRGSTRAIAQGRYKDVNMIGACCIIAASNACPGLQFPSVFGGDGASLAVPESRRDAVVRALLKAREMSTHEFGLDLRIAAIPVAVIRATGLDVRVGKHRASPQSVVAMFDGGGLAHAEQLMKRQGSSFEVAAGMRPEGDFTGLECRWSPLRSRHGVMMACIAQVRPGVAQPRRIYQGILGEIGAILDRRRPLSVENLQLEWPPPFLMRELKARLESPWRRWFEYSRLLLLSLGHAAFMKAFKRDASRGIGRYVHEVSLNTDRVKFDDALRFVIDVDDADARTIRERLEARRRAGEIHYGIHTSATALLTCFVRSYTDDHFHFIDGGDGGYAMAAKQMKAQIAEERAAPPAIRGGEAMNRDDLQAEIQEQEKLAAVLRERLADRDSPMSDTHTWQDDLDLCNARLKELRRQLERTAS